MKTCRTCDESKPEIEFHFLKRDGIYRPSCIVCVNARRRFLKRCGERLCNTCKKTKPVSEFLLNGRLKGGVHSNCKQCEHGTKQAAIDAIVTKKCPRCNTIRPLNEFYRNKHAFKGVTGWCKECSKEKQKALYLTHGEDKINELIERAKSWKRKNHNKHREAVRVLDKKQQESLEDAYILRLLRKAGFATGFSRANPELIQLKRVMLQIKRKIKN